MTIDLLPYPKIIRELYDQYYLKSQQQAKEYSSHWRKYSEASNVNIDPKGRIVAVGCGFGDMYHQKPWHKLASAFTISSYLRKMPDRVDLEKLIKVALDVLPKFSSYMSYDVFRQLCSLALIRKHLPFKSKDAFKVLIIGDGYGFLSAIIRSIYPNACIILVDIGSILLFQALNLQKVFSSNTHDLLSGNNANECDFMYCRAKDISLLREKRFDLSINISSMQEMTNEMIREYFSLIRQTSNDDNFFYCCNRKLKILPCGERIEYKNYPWQEDDQILLEESPLFYKYYYSHRFPFKHYFEPMFHRIVRMAVARERL
ncbi:MAG: putative sugar O-methyltransferase [Candidatus Omnitrophica bacterium]|nr:putative sugar O-methyltransferase [Candidatus Omnitrophota bacterium]